MLCALLDSIEEMVNKVRCADLTRDGAARTWFATRKIEIERGEQLKSGNFDFVIADAEDHEGLERSICEDGLALIRLREGATEIDQKMSGPWGRVAHVVSGNVHWQLWRREGALEPPG